MHIVDISESGQLFDQVYAQILTPSFPPDELMTADELRAGLTDGSVALAATVDGDGRVTAAACVEWSAPTGLLLLAYLAVRPGQRGGGLGGRLLEYAIRTWVPRFGAMAMLAEIEHPEAHQGSPSYGDPGARVRFYARHGGRALALPYFQPPVRPDGRRVYGLMLAVLTMSESAAGPRPDTMAAPPLRAFLTDALTDAEGSRPADPATSALLSSLDDESGVALLPLDQPALIPVSTPGGPLPGTPGSPGPAAGPVARATRRRPE